MRLCLVLGVAPYLFRYGGNQVRWHETETYTRTFATFLIRTAFRIRGGLG